MLDNSGLSNFITPDTAVPDAFKIAGTPIVDSDEHIPQAEYPYLVKGLFHENQVVVVYGPPNVGKSAIVASVCAHISMGLPISDRKTKRAGVIYNAAEDAVGILDRLYPLRRKRDDEAAKVIVRRGGLNLIDADACKSYIRDVQHLQKAGVLPERVIHVFDTLTLCLGDGDENSSRDVGVAMKNAHNIVEHTNGTALIVHHAALEKDRPRGSSALTGNADTVLYVSAGETAQDGQATALISPAKQRSMKKGHRIVFGLEDFTVGEDEDGDVRTIPMAVPFGDQVVAEPVGRAPAKAPASPDLTAQRIADVVEVLGRLGADDSEKWHTATQVAELCGSPFDTVRGNSDSLAKKVREALKAAAAKGQIERDGSKWRIADHRDDD